MHVTRPAERELTPLSAPHSVSGVEGAAMSSPSGARPTRIAMLADLAEPLGPDATTETGVTAYEIVRAVGGWAATSGAATVDLFARRGSWRGLPLVSVDPDELGPVSDDPLAWFAVQEAVYERLWSAGALTGYDVVHCLAGIVTPLPFLVAAGTPVVQTLLEAPDHPSCWLLPRLLPGRSVRRLAVAEATGAALGIPVAPACVDLSRFVPADVPGRHLVWDGTGGADGATMAAVVAARLGYPLRTVGDMDPVTMLQQAVAMLHLSPTASAAGVPWAVRALACGIPMAGWQGPLDGFAGEPACAALVPVGEWEVLGDRIRCLPDAAEARWRRRQTVLARYGSTAMVARYRAIYRELLE
jgi:hypothetical protein